MAEASTAAKQERKQDAGQRSAAQETARSQQAPQSAYSSSSAGVTAFYEKGGVTKHDTGKGTTGEQGPERSMSDLTDTQQQSIRAACTRAIQMVPKAIAACEAAKRTPNATVTHAFKLKGDSSKDKKALDKAIANYRKVASALAGGLSFEGEDSPAEDGMVTIAYVYTGFVGLFDGDIHICFPGWDQLSPDGQAATIIHELTHQKCGTDDNAYMHETGKWNGMSTKDALNNAASYEYLALNAP